jgi:prevent-host-death family protein
LEVFLMAKIPAIIPVSDLRQDAARVLKEVRGSKEPVFITQRGRAAAVLMSIDAYQHSETQRELLLLLARGEKEIASGVGHELDRVLAEADVLLAE